MDEVFEILESEFYGVGERYGVGIFVLLQKFTRDMEKAFDTIQSWPERGTPDTLWLCLQSYADATTTTAARAMDALVSNNLLCVLNGEDIHPQNVATVVAEMERVAIMMLAASALHRKAIEQREKGL